MLRKRDRYFEAVKTHWTMILRAYALHEDKKPIVLLDVTEARIYVCPYEEYRADLSQRSQKTLTEQYERALREDELVVFVRDDKARKLVSYSVPCDERGSMDRPAERRRRREGRSPSTGS